MADVLKNKKNEILLDKKTSILKALHFVIPVASHYWFLEIQWIFLFYSTFLFNLFYCLQLWTPYHKYTEHLHL